MMAMGGIGLVIFAFLVALFDLVFWEEHRERRTSRQAKERRIKREAREQTERSRRPPIL